MTESTEATPHGLGKGEKLAVDLMHRCIGVTDDDLFHALVAVFLKLRCKIGDERPQFKISSSSSLMLTSSSSSARISIFDIMRFART